MSNLEGVSEEQFESAVRAGWYFASKLNSSAKHIDASNEDLVNTAVQKLMDGTRTFDPDREFKDQLFLAIRSEFLNSQKRIKVRIKALSEKYDRIAPLHDTIQSADSEIYADQLYSALYAEANKKSDYLVMNLLDSLRYYDAELYRNKECADKLRVNTEDIRNAKKRLQNMIKRLLKDQHIDTTVAAPTESTYED